MNTTDIKKHWYHFLAPRFWGMWLALALLRLIICLPYPAILKIGHGLGHIARLILKKKRHITCVNLKLCFPELTELERSHLLKKNFASVGVGILEAALAWWSSDKRLRKLVKFYGLPNLQAAKEKNKGVLLIASHVTTIELGLRMLSFVSPITILYLPPTNLLFAWILQHARKRYIQTCIVQNDMRGLLRNLKNDTVICYTPDQDKGRNSSVFAPFFGVNAATVKTTAKLLSHTQAAAVSVFFTRHESAQQYSLTISPLLKGFPTGDEIADATKINTMLEEMIRPHPEQYMWQHRRFKTRPLGEPSVY